MDLFEVILHAHDQEVMFMKGLALSKGWGQIAMCTRAWVSALHFSCQ